MPDGEQFEEPISAMAANAAGMHEMFRSYLAAGFTERQAVMLIAEMLATANRTNLEAGGQP